MVTKAPDQLTGAAELLKALASTTRRATVVELGEGPKVKAGNRYRVGDGQIEVDSVDLVPFAAIDEDDLPRSGEADLESLRRRAAHAGPISDDTLVYRVEFQAVA